VIPIPGGCGCAGSSCSCTIIAGRGARVRGAGTLNNPYVIDAFPMSLVVQDSPSVDLSLSGSGTAASPWVVTATVGGDIFDSKWGMWSGNQAAYDALGSYDSGTLYLVTAA